MSTSNSFVQADSRNLPEVDFLMIIEYSLASEKYSLDQIRAFKNFARSQSDYVEDAIGFVKLKRSGTECIVKAKVLPEVNIEDGKKYFAVTAKVNEADNTIIDAACDCSDSPGCKHTLMFLNWLQKKAAIPERAPVQCYWHKPIHGMSLRIEDIFKKKKNNGNESRLGPPDPEVLQQFFEECRRRNITNSLIMSYAPPP